MLKGGSGCLLQASMHEAVLFLQTGHWQAKAVCDYIHILDPAVLMQSLSCLNIEDCRDLHFVWAHSVGLRGGCSPTELGLPLQNGSWCFQPSRHPA